MIENYIIIILIIILLILLINFKKRINTNCNLCKETLVNQTTKKNKVIKINKWFGRLGNNIYQVINFIHLAIELDCNIIIPSHEFFNKQYIKINDMVQGASSEVLFVDDATFFMDTTYIENKFNNKNIFNKNKEKALNILKDLFIIKYKDIPDCNDDDLYIHIRSGDIFIGEGSPSYTQPPLDFYVKIIESNKFNKIYILAEDDLNPCINILLKKYPNIVWNKTQLIDDIKLIMKCKNFIYGKSLLTTHILLFNEGLIKSWDPSMYNFDGYYEAITKANNMTYYKGIFNIWYNKPEQLKVMIEYKL